MSDYVISLDGESTGPEGTYLVWYRSGKVEVDHCVSLQDALEEARMHDNSEYALFDFIEGPAGVVPEDDVHRWLRRREEKYREAQQAAWDKQAGKTRYHIVVRSLDGKSEGECDFVFDEGKAMEVVQELNLPGRVKVYATVEDGKGSRPGGNAQRVILDYSTRE